MACTRVPLKRPRSKTSSDQLQKTSKQDPTNFTNSTSKGRAQQELNSAEANSTFFFFNVSIFSIKNISISLFSLFDFFFFFLSLLISLFFTLFSFFNFNLKNGQKT